MFRFPLFFFFCSFSLEWGSAKRGLRKSSESTARIETGRAFPSITDLHNEYSSWEGERAAKKSIQKHKKIPFSFQQTEENNDINDWRQNSVWRVCFSEKSFHSGGKAFTRQTTLYRGSHLDLHLLAEISYQRERFSLCRNKITSKKGVAALEGKPRNYYSYSYSAGKLQKEVLS